ncbi:Small GTPase superfamily [Carpediemonas membranifera]|uniref:Small GTPase superfamily n=1 Tax=Carpediemonas membranifera TaxID=201153 RepID=A0A8J6E1R6_9EUKA|nr:Small GTPase superfamily [Carpediemonas membranifera]|eukprot:KAG9393803.1 Small GTPase superfamily [Carpediemonas membranifera]
MEKWQTLLDEIDDDEPLCPLCGEKLDTTEICFFPCPCKYQVCRFCLHKLKQTDARCPACRKPYDDKDAHYEDVQVNVEPVTRSNKQSMSRNGGGSFYRTHSQDSVWNRQDDLSHLTNVRVLQRNLVYLVNLPSNIARESILRQHSMLGQYGKITKIIINSGNTSHDSACAYATFAKSEDATTAIVAVDGTYFGGKQIQASFGTTKYCSNFLQHRSCSNPECMYLHELGEEVLGARDKAHGPARTSFNQLVKPTLPSGRVTFAATPDQDKCFPPPPGSGKKESSVAPISSSPAPWANVGKSKSKPATPIPDSNSKTDFPTPAEALGQKKKGSQSQSQSRAASTSRSRQNPPPDLPPGFPAGPTPQGLLMNAVQMQQQTASTWAGTAPTPARPTAITAPPTPGVVALAPTVVPAHGGQMPDPSRLALPQEYDIQQILRLGPRSFSQAAAALFSRGRFANENKAKNGSVPRPPRKVEGSVNLVQMLGLHA